MGIPAHFCTTVWFCFKDLAEREGPGALSTVMRATSEIGESAPPFGPNQQLWISPQRARSPPRHQRRRKPGQSERNNGKETLRWRTSSCVIHRPSPSYPVKSWRQRCFGRSTLLGRNQHSPPPPSAPRGPAASAEASRQRCRRWLLHECDDALSFRFLPPSPQSSLLVSFPLSQSSVLITSPPC